MKVENLHGIIFVRDFLSFTKHGNEILSNGIFHGHVILTKYVLINIPIIYSRSGVPFYIPSQSMFNPDQANFANSGIVSAPKYHKS